MAVTFTNIRVWDTGETLPERVVNVITCVNPRCVTTTEPGIDQVFYLDRTDGEAYRCRYCDEEAEF